MPLHWKSTAALIKPVSDVATHTLVSVKDPTIVRYNNKWHVYATTANAQGNWSMVYLSFSDWSEAADAKPYYLDNNPNLRGYHCAPQVFYFRPQKKWYLIYQSQPPQFSTADDLSKPETWTKPESFFATKPPGYPPGSGLTSGSSAMRQTRIFFLPEMTAASIGAGPNLRTSPRA